MANECVETWWHLKCSRVSYSVWNGPCVTVAGTLCVVVATTVCAALWLPPPAWHLLCCPPLPPMGSPPHSALAKLTRARDKAMNAGQTWEKYDDGIGNVLYKNRKTAEVTMEHPIKRAKRLWKEKCAASGVVLDWANDEYNKQLQVRVWTVVVCVGLLERSDVGLLERSDVGLLECSVVWCVCGRGMCVCVGGGASGCAHVWSGAQWPAGVCGAWDLAPVSLAHP
jgi:hypothetical protein